MSNSSKPEDTDISTEAEKLMRIAEQATGVLGYGVSANFVVALGQYKEIWQREARIDEVKHSYDNELPRRIDERIAELQAHQPTTTGEEE